VLIDATVIRAVLLPSVMVLLGERNWYLPRWLARFTARGARRRPPLAGYPGRVEPGLQRVPSPSLEDP
jgi:RND superfamily putative drug exporter